VTRWTVLDIPSASAARSLSTPSKSATLPALERPDRFCWPPGRCAAAGPASGLAHAPAGRRGGRRPPRRGGIPGGHRDSGRPAVFARRDEWVTGCRTEEPRRRPDPRPRSAGRPPASRRGDPRRRDRRPDIRPCGGDLHRQPDGSAGTGRPDRGATVDQPGGHRLPWRAGRAGHRRRRRGWGGDGQRLGRPGLRDYPSGHRSPLLMGDPTPPSAAHREEPGHSSLSGSSRSGWRKCACREQHAHLLSSMSRLRGVRRGP